jgi:hypothetical protein
MCYIYISILNEFGSSERVANTPKLSSLFASRRVLSMHRSHYASSRGGFLKSYWVPAGIVNGVENKATQPWTIMSLRS